MLGLLAAGCGLLGLLIGSFLNVVIHRVPQRVSVVRPRSSCPECGAAISNRDNIPVLSWVLLRGRCRHCAHPIPVRYPLVEVATAVLFAVTAVRIGAEWELPAYLLFTAVLIAVTVIDLQHFIVPNRIVFPTLYVSVPLLALAALLAGEWSPLWTALIGALIGGVSLFVIHFVYPRGMGMGDVKLALVLGLYLGWLGIDHVVLGLFLGFLLGAVIGLGLIALRLRSRKDHVPFAPFLAAGAYLAVLFGEPLLRWYLGT